MIINNIKIKTNNDLDKITTDNRALNTMIINYNKREKILIELDNGCGVTLTGVSKIKLQCDEIAVIYRDESEEPVVVDMDDYFDYERELRPSIVGIYSL